MWKPTICRSFSYAKTPWVFHIATEVIQVRPDSVASKLPSKGVAEPRMLQKWASRGANVVVVGDGTVGVVGGWGYCITHEITIKRGIIQWGNVSLNSKNGDLSSGYSTHRWKLAHFQMI